MRFAVALTCIDGRVHEPLAACMRQGLGVDAVDLVTVPGPDKVLTSDDDAWVDRLVERVRVSVRAHGSTHLVVASHSDCAGHPVGDADHEHDVGAAVARLSALLPELVVAGIHLRADGDRFVPEPVGGAG